MEEMWEALRRWVQRAAKHAVAIGVLAACFAAAHASASPALTVFRLSVVATLHAEWDHTGAPAPFGDCRRTTRSEGIRDARFRTAKPTIVRIADGRLRAASVQAVTGTVTLAGANTVSDVCGGETKEAIQDCATTKRSFQGATIGVVGTRPGSVGLGSVRKVRLRTSTCPLEPSQVVRAPLAPVPTPLNISTAALANSRVTHITLTATATRTTTFGPVEHGTMRQRAVWKVTFERV